MRIGSLLGRGFGTGGGGRPFEERSVGAVRAPRAVGGGVPEHIRSDNGPEFTAEAVRGRLDRVGVKALFIEPGSPWEDGYIESSNGELSDELPEGEVFDTPLEAEVPIERYRVRYNAVR